ncbi:MAG: non-histone chromosomal MC1 family protein [Candidatus Aminicenantia bacterium]
MPKSKGKKKSYVLKKGNKISIFTGRSPRQAALKAATRGIKDIRLRERGKRNKDKTYTIHVFKGEVKMVGAPERRPAWLPARIRKATVRKVGIERVKKI